MPANGWMTKLCPPNPFIIRIIFFKSCKFAFANEDIFVMDANAVRQTFLDFFRSKGHHIVSSAPMVVKDDPTLMFNNSGMAPFKDIFLGNAPILHPRIADTQKCLRVSG